MNDLSRIDMRNVDDFERLKKMGAKFYYQVFDGPFVDGEEYGIGFSFSANCDSDSPYMICNLFEDKESIPDHLKQLLAQ